MNKKLKIMRLKADCVQLNNEMKDCQICPIKQECDEVSGSIFLCSWENEKDFDKLFELLGED